MRQGCPLSAPFWSEPRRLKPLSLPTLWLWTSSKSTLAKFDPCQQTIDPCQICHSGSRPQLPQLLPPSPTKLCLSSGTLVVLGPPRQAGPTGLPSARRFRRSMTPAQRSSPGAQAPLTLTRGGVRKVRVSAAESVHACGPWVSGLFYVCFAPATGPLHGSAVARQLRASGGLGEI
jgi:hypothetical protein